MNRRKADRRREVSRTVKTVRERLSSTTGTRPAFDYEVLLGYARNRMAAWLAIAIMVLAVGYSSIYFVPVEALAAWGAVAFGIHALNGLTYRRFVSQPATDVNLQRWQRQFTIGEVLFGIVFGALFVIPSELRDQAAVLQFGTILLSVAVIAMVGSNLPKAVIGGTLPITLLGGASFALVGDFLSLTIAVFVVFAEGFFIVLAFRMRQNALAMLEFRAEKDALIAELEQANAISDESRRRAEEANLAKSRFLATMSHELRTPLNAILGFSEIMQGEVFGAIGNAHYKEYVTDIHNSGKHLLNLINEILDLSRIEAGRYQLNEEAVTLAHVAEDCHHLMKLKAKTKNLTIHQQFEPDLPKIWADERAIRQIILNLLSNAVKFTPSGGEIWIKMGWTVGGGQYVSIRDNGPGIPEDEIPIVLSAFGQGSLAIKTAEQGTGLGLPIVKALMTMHGGKFELKSKLREGTEAMITFPAARVMEVMPAIPDRVQPAPAPMRRAVG
ncbi:sensor histidine kinase [Mongoliimonas terrestris]|uniref:sensor histidine kinase n=1 Tax=Mongoliimonas terrestris TaxID=1709001 RepID=UPI001FD9FC1A|nr:HAMP domain-containing sensor histidine kinase [Mongoliimonas terrestris]